jgi:hypothetical protein
MDPNTMQMEIFRIGAAVTFAAILLGIGGWVLTTWMRMRHGYPLGDANDAVYPLNSGETIERVRLLTQDNAQLRAEIGAVKDRLATVERIVTDGAYGLDREIDGLRSPAN